MRQQLISWLMNDIAPAIEKSRNAEESILKFAHERNLAPALVETLGQLYNTAKTVAHLEKSANRGSDFPLLDVPELMSKYLTVEKKASRGKLKGESAYDQFNCDGKDGDELPEYFKHIGVPVVSVKDDIIEKKASETPLTRADYRAMAHAARNIETMEQIVFDTTEDIRQGIDKVAFLIKQAGVDFEQIETDAFDLLGADCKPVLDGVAGRLSNKFVQVKRASASTQVHRLVADPHGILEAIEKVNKDMIKLALAQAMIETEKKAAGSVLDVPIQNATESRSTTLHSHAPSNEKKPSKEKEAPQGEGKHKSISHGESPIAKVPFPSDKAQGKATSQMEQPAGPSYIKPIMAAGQGLADIPGKLHGMKKGLEDFLGSGFNSDQQTVDRGYQDAKHLSVLQQLLMNDDVLADADHEKVVSMFNTLRQTAPSLAADPNIAGVALRSMIQHEGISPFDVKSFLETENAGQKNEMNRKVMDSMEYGGAPVPKPNKVV